MVFQYETQKLVPSDATSIDDHFGSTVVIDGNTLLAAAEIHNTSGAVYVYERDAGGTWNETAQLLPDDPVDYGFFGSSIALSGSTAFVGSYNHADGDVSHAGKVYVFERDSNGTWNAAGQITRNDTASFDSFGLSMAANGDRLAVGGIHSTDYGETALGSVYIFERDAYGVWQQVSKLQSTDPQPCDWFGHSVGLSGDTLFVGDLQKGSGNLAHVGIVYVFRRDPNGSWLEVTRLQPSDPEPYGYFGSSIALSSSTAVIGAAEKNQAMGEAYVFEQDAGGNWTEKQKLVDSDPVDYAEFSHFGTSVAINGVSILVGAPDEYLAGRPNASGTVFIFRRDANRAWMEVDRLLSSDPSSSFGEAVSLSEDSAVIGAVGALYVYSPGSLPAPVILEPAADSLLRTGMPTFRGSAVPGSTVTILEAHSTMLCSTAVDAAGSWSCSSTKTLADGSHTVAAGVAAGDNRSNFTSVTFSVDTRKLTISQQPATAQACEGKSASFSANASGYMRPAVQWLESPDGTNWANIPGATQYTFTLPSVSLNMNGYRYKAVFATGDESLESKPAPLEVYPWPQITRDPLSQTARPGETVTFRVEVSAPATPRIAWQYRSSEGDNWNLFASGDSLTVQVDALKNGSQYRAVVSTFCTVFSQPATLTVAFPPFLNSQPQNARVCAGSKVSFSASAGGSPLPTAQWQVKAKSTTDYSDLDNETSNTLTFTASAAQDGNQYRVIYSNQAGNMTSEAAMLTVASPLSGLQVKANAPFYQVGDTVIYHAEINGQPAAEAHWQVSRDAGAAWIDIPGANGAALAFTMQPCDQESLYRAVVENACGNSISTTLSLQSFEIYLPIVRSGY